MDGIGLDWIGIFSAYEHKYNDWHYTTVGHNEIMYMAVNRLRKGKRDDHIREYVARVTVYWKDET